MRFGPFEADFDAGELRKHGRRVRLQDQPLKILALLCERAGRLVTRDELRAHLWPADTFVDFEHGLNTAVKRLRDVLGDAADRPSYVETLPRRGYRLIVPVEIVPVEVVPVVVADQGGATAHPVPEPRRTRTTPEGGPHARTVAIAAGMCAVFVAAWVLNVGFRPRTSAALKHLEIELPGDQELNEQPTPFALSHDGSKLIFAAGSFQGARLFMRSLDDPGTTRLVGAVSARSPAFSPDDRWVAFAVDDDTTLRKVPASGGPGVVLARTDGFLNGGLDWGAGAIYFSAGGLAGAGVSRVAETGGTPEPVTTPDPRRGEIAHVFPQVLPGGRNLLFTVKAGEGRQADQVVVHSLATGARRVILHGASRARYLAGGHLVYAQGRDLLAVPFHLERLAIAGTPVVVVRGLSTDVEDGSRFAAAEDGTLVYMPERRSNERRLVWVDRAGTETQLGAPPNAYSFPSLSPNGSPIAVKVTAVGVAAKAGDVWIYEPTADSLRQLTFSGTVLNAIWTPDGTAVTYSMPQARTFAMVRHSTTGDRRSETLFSRGLGLWPGSWTPDGRALCYMEATSSGTGGDLSIFETGPAARHRPMLATTSTEWGGRISPDGRWMAYISNQSGRWEVFLRPFTGAGGPVQVSRDGGTEVMWAPTGRELFYRQSDAVLVAPIRSGPTLVVGAPRRLFSGPYTSVLPGVANYDVAPDGSRLLMIRAGPAETAPRSLRVVLNWPGRVDRPSR